MLTYTQSEGLSALRAIDGIELASAWYGRLKRFDWNAAVSIESGDQAAFMLDVGGALEAELVLGWNRSLLGNVRFARTARRTVLIGETPLVHPGAVARGVEEIAESFSTALALVRAGASAVRAEPARALSSVAEQVEPIADRWQSLAPDGVRVPGGIELRPRIAGAVVPVRVERRDEHLLVHGSLVREREQSSWQACGASAEYLLRANATVHGARLALEGSTVVAQTRLAMRDANRETLAQAARSVACIRRRLEPGLSLLITQPRVATCYADMFITTLDHEQEQP